MLTSYWFWFAFWCTQPAFLFIGLLGLLGDEAKKAAEDVAVGLTVLMLTMIVGIAIYFALDGVGII